MTDELIDWVDAADRVIGQVTRRAMRARTLKHRATAVLVRNCEGRIFVHRRTSTKDIYPSCWDMFIGGVVLQGETYEESARRELEEEIGVREVSLEFLFRYDYISEDNTCFVAVFQTVYDGPVTFQEEEVVEGRFMTEEELIAFMPRNSFVCDGLKVWEHYLAWRETKE